MAAANPAQLLLGEVTCAVCLDYFKDPVSLDCGHHFCQACITRCWEALSTNFHCPECRETFSQRNFKPNRQLRNIVEASRTLTLEPEVQMVCEKHNEDLKVFCQEDQTPICMVCHLSRDHKEHPVVPIEEAAEDYKVRNHGMVHELLKQLETEKQKIVSEFQQLRQFLEKQERLRLAQLEELNQEIEKGRAEYLAKLSEEISSFSSLISEMEQKCQQPASEFLQVRWLLPSPRARLPACCSLPGFPLSLSNEQRGAADFLTAANFCCQLPGSILAQPPPAQLSFIVQSEFNSLA
uniref:Uncharacterized protein n=1 Tax=Chrysemys picta bellii TaxID=8478 RepID=A0A8C3HMS5_CHRPI